MCIFHILKIVEDFLMVSLAGRDNEGLMKALAFMIFDTLLQRLRETQDLCGFLLYLAETVVRSNTQFTQLKIQISVGNGVKKNAFVYSSCSLFCSFYLGELLTYVHEPVENKMGHLLFCWLKSCLKVVVTLDFSLASSLQLLGTHLPEISCFHDQQVTFIASSTEC